MRYLPTVLAASVALTACELPAPPVCNDILIASLVVAVETVDGRPAADGATLIVRAGTYADTATEYWDGLHVAAGARPGTFKVSVTKPGYAEGTLSAVLAVGGPCGVEVPTETTVTLVQLAP